MYSAIRSGSVPGGLLALPSELHYIIFSRLFRVSSICLGLTCKKLYGIHKTFYPKAGEFRLTELAGYDSYLGDLLNNWAGPNVCFEIRFNIWSFITIEEWMRHAQKWAADYTLHELMISLEDKQAGKVIPWDKIGGKSARERTTFDNDKPLTYGSM